MPRGREYSRTGACTFLQVTRSSLLFACKLHCCEPLIDRDSGALTIVPRQFFKICMSYLTSPDIGITDKEYFHTVSLISCALKTSTSRFERLGDCLGEEFRESRVTQPCLAIRSPHRLLPPRTSLLFWHDTANGPGFSLEHKSTVSTIPSNILS